jgi:hypothetical protein
MSGVYLTRFGEYSNTVVCLETNLNRSVAATDCAYQRYRMFLPLFGFKVESCAWHTEQLTYQPLACFSVR